MPDLHVARIVRARRRSVIPASLMGHQRAYERIDEVGKRREVNELDRATERSQTPRHGG